MLELDSYTVTEPDLLEIDTLVDNLVSELEQDDFEQAQDCADKWVD